MSKKLLLTCLCVAASVLWATSAMALIGFGTPNMSATVLDHLVGEGNNSGTTAGTILNPEGKGDVLIFPYYDVRELNGKSQDFHFFIINNETDQC